MCFNEAQQRIPWQARKICGHDGNDRHDALGNGSEEGGLSEALSGRPATWVHDFSPVGTRIDAVELARPERTRGRCIISLAPYELARLEVWRRNWAAAV